MGGPSKWGLWSAKSSFAIKNEHVTQFILVINQLDAQNFVLQ